MREADRKAAGRDYAVQAGLQIGAVTPEASRVRRSLRAKVPALGGKARAGR